MTAPSPSTSTPSVSVLMAVHNGGAFLEPALRSMMGQTLRDIEIIVVDDASTDGTPSVLARLAAEDGRIRVERLAENLRLPRALNRGLDLVRAPLVARMDADDLADPRRLELQTRHMAAHPGTVLLGSSFREINEEGRVLRTKVQGRNAYGARWISRFHCPVLHSSFMFRSRLPDGTRPFYDPVFSVSEDYDFAVRMQRHGDVVNLPDVLLSYRLHGASITHKNWNLQLEQVKSIALRHQRAELPEPVVLALEPMMAAMFESRPSNPRSIFAGLRRMTDHDVAQAPDERAWVRQNAAKLARHAMVHSGLGRGAVLRAFLGPGRDFLADMMLRALDAKLGLRTTLRGGVDAGRTKAGAPPSPR